MAKLPAIFDKIVSRKEAQLRVDELPKPVIFTNGVFDVLHAGHVSYLAQARALGASLVVALNTDRSAKRLGKGPDRPLNNELDRATVLAALESASLVTWKKLAWEHRSSPFFKVCSERIPPCPTGKR